MDQILQQLSDERRAQQKADERTQSIPKEPHPRATPQTATDKTRDDKNENPDPESATVAAKQTRTNPATVARHAAEGDNEASTVKTETAAPVAPAGKEKAADNSAGKSLKDS